MVIVGSGPEEAWLRAQIKELNLQDRVTFRGWMTTQELYESVYPNIDVFIHLAQMEGAPIALAEALLHGAVPVVSEFVGCLTEQLFVHDRNSLLFVVGNTIQAASHVEQLHSDRKLLARLSAAAVDSRDQVLSPQDMVDGWAQALNLALELPPTNGVCPAQGRFTSTSRLERWGIPRSWGDALRRWTNREFIHSEPGGEWPHCSGLATTTALNEIAEFARQLERQNHHANLASI